MISNTDQTAEAGYRSGAALALTCAALGEAPTRRQGPETTRRQGRGGPAVATSGLRTDGHPRQAVGALRAAFIQGRADEDEFDLRVGRTLRARTYAELDALDRRPPWPGRPVRPPVARREADISPRGRRARRIPGSWLPSRSSRPLSQCIPKPRPCCRHAHTCGRGHVRGAPHGLIPVHRHQHAGQADLARRSPKAIAFTPAGRPPTSSTIAAVSSPSRPPPTRRQADQARGDNRWRSRSRRTARPPTSSPSPVRDGQAIPVATGTNTPGKPIRLAGTLWRSRSRRTAGPAPTSSASTKGKLSGSVIPVAIATNTPGPPILISGGDSGPTVIAITPDGKTAYVVGAPPTRSSRSGPPPARRASRSRSAAAPLMAIAITPGGETAYVVSGNAGHSGHAGATATNTPGTPIKSAVCRWAIAITPDGKSAYVLDDPAVLGLGGFRRPPGHTGRDRHQHAGQADQDRPRH